MPILGEIFAEYLARADIPSAGYEPWFVANGVQPQLARLLAQILVRRGEREARESKYLPKVVRTIKELARQRRSRRPTLTRRARLLLHAYKETSIVEAIFDRAGLREHEFIKILGQVADGGYHDLGRLAEIAAIIVPFLPETRGVTISAATAAHEFFLEVAVPPLKGRSAYTWNFDKEDFTDPETIATRLEYRMPNFDPRAAYRKLKARSARKSSI